MTMLPKDFSGTGVEHSVVTVLLLAAAVEPDDLAVRQADCRRMRARHPAAILQVLRYGLNVKHLYAHGLAPSLIGSVTPLAGMTP